MKVRITLKDPDGYYDETNEVFKHDGDMSKIPEEVSQWFEFNEYLTVEIDTETGTITVIKP